MLSDDLPGPKTLQTREHSAWVTRCSRICFILRCDALRATIHLWSVDCLAVNT